MGACHSQEGGRPVLSRRDSPELSRRLHHATPPVRVSTRAIQKEVVQSQREEASKSFTSERSQRRGSRLALKIDVKQPAGIAVVPRSQRMSRLGSVRRAMMIQGIESAAKSAESPRSLDARLGELGMKMNVMEGDGNCQFRAAAYNLFGAQAYHAVVRQSAVEHMRKHADFFGIYFEDEREFNDYLQTMSQARTWGDELTLRAIVEVYCCEAHVITSESANWYLAYSPDTEEERDASIARCPNGLPLPPKGKQIFLSYISPIHYNAIISAV